MGNHARQIADVFTVPAGHGPRKQSVLPLLTQSLDAAWLAIRAEAFEPPARSSSRDRRQAPAVLPALPESYKGTGEIPGTC